MTSVFVSYAHEDADCARALAHRLGRRGLQVIFDEWDVLPGDVTVHHTEAAIDSAACALVLISPASRTSPWAREEYAALLTAGTRRSLRLIPVLIGDAPLPPLAASRVWRDFRHMDGSGYEEKVDELVAAIRGETVRGGSDGSAAPGHEENIAAAQPLPPRPLTPPDQPAVVLCYAAADAAYGQALADQLRRAGLPVWSVADLRPGDSHVWSAQQQLDFAAAVIVLMSPSSQESEDVTRMILEAMHHRRPFFPVLIEGQRNYLLAHTWYVDARDGRLLNEDEVGLLKDLDAASRNGASPDGTPTVIPAPPSQPAVETVRVPASVSLGRLDSYLAERNFAYADLQTTAIVLEAADRLDEGWLSTRHVRRVPAEVLARVDGVWADHTHGRQGWRAQAALAVVRSNRHLDFLALSVACGWRSSKSALVPRSYQELTKMAGPGPRNAYYPTLRNPQNEPFSHWYDEWVSTVLAVHLHMGNGGR
ncbi:TIR domain-containing protein [Streptomyces alfalfae]|uniref:TIR domain-containing protein n=1 Tax=Streptomyces alfalfae TaxID=1642299 RepID=A0A7T4U2J6_9ACTN|nr:TIR domain-containing protein [Streptomyces alfalfae]